MTLKEYYFKTDFGNKRVHLKGNHGLYFQSHMVDTFDAYKNEEVNDKTTVETDTDVYIELVPRKALFWRYRK